MRFRRLVLLAVAPLALAALLGSPAPTGAGVMFNGLTLNALNTNAITFNALAATGTALADLDGVTVEAVTLPDAAE
jgi:hypothetical protein